MAIRFDAAGDYIIRTANLPASDVFTVSFWFRIVTDVNAIGYIWLLTNSGGTSTVSARLKADGTTLEIATSYGGNSPGGTSLSVGVWYHLAFVRNGSAHTLYLNGVSDQTLSAAGTFTAANMLMASNSVNYVNGRMAAIKIWDAALTQDEVRREMYTIRPMRRANINLWAPGFPGTTERVNDYSGNGRDWTAVGALADEAGPPVPWGFYCSPQVSAAAAISEIIGTLDKSQAGDTLAGVGDLDIVGALAKTQGADGLSAAGQLAIVGALDKAQLGDSLAAASGLAVSATLSKIQAGDALSAVGALAIDGDLSKAQAGDSLLATGAVAIVGAVSKTQGGDMLIGASAALLVTAALNKTQAGDALSATGSSSTAIAGELAKTQAGDSVSGAAGLSVVAALSQAQSGDSLAIAGTLAIVAALVIVASGNALSAAAGEGEIVTLTKPYRSPDVFRADPFESAGRYNQLSGRRRR